MVLFAALNGTQLLSDLNATQLVPTLNATQLIPGLNTTDPSLLSSLTAPLHAVWASLKDGTVLEKIGQTLVSWLGLLLSMLVGLIAAAFNGMAKLAGQMMMQISSQIIGTSIVGAVVYRYKEEVKDLLDNFVTRAVEAIPGDFIDAEEIVDMIEDGLGIDTESEDESEGGGKGKSKGASGKSTPTEETPLLQGADSFIGALVGTAVEALPGDFLETENIINCVERGLGIDGEDEPENGMPEGPGEVGATVTASGLEKGDEGNTGNEPIEDTPLLSEKKSKGGE